MADTPEHFDVIVMQNLYGDILSDVAAQITGSVGLAGSSNIGASGAMFEAIHGSAPDIAGKNIANPSGLLRAAVLMLKHIGEGEAATAIENAWLKTIEEGIHTPDIYNPSNSSKKVGTKEFAEAVISNLGNMPTTLKGSNKSADKPFELPKLKERKPALKELVGVDVFVDHTSKNPEEVASVLQSIALNDLQLLMITNRGVKVWPHGFEETYCTNHWRCRFMPKGERRIGKDEVVGILQNALEKGVDVIKTENLYEFDGKKAYSLGQGQ